MPVNLTKAVILNSMRLFVFAFATSVDSKDTERRAKKSVRKVGGMEFTIRHYFRELNHGGGGGDAAVVVVVIAAMVMQAESVDIVDTYGDGRHVSIDVISSQFEGKNSVKRQQAVYKAIWLELQVRADTPPPPWTSTFKARFLGGRLPG
jgi:acid stress-induced BolA-like protein IbaG/YrbA